MSAMANTKKDTFAWVEWIIAEREKQGLTQSELARKSGLTRQTINDYESRRRPNPDSKVLVKLSVGLGYPADHLQRIVGILPPDTTTSDEVKQIIEEIKGLTTEEQQELLSYIKWSNNQRKKK
jgi:transcriptional regulator with XRE-family HTH domain